MTSRYNIFAYIACHHLNLPDIQKRDIAEYVANTIANIRKAAEQVPNTYVAIALDNRGAEIRTGLLKGVSRKLCNMCEKCICTYYNNILIKIIVLAL